MPAPKKGNTGAGAPPAPGADEAQSGAGDLPAAEAAAGVPGLPASADALPPAIVDSNAPPQGDAEREAAAEAERRQAEAAAEAERQAAAATEEAERQASAAAAEAERQKALEPPAPVVSAADEELHPGFPLTLRFENHTSRPIRLHQHGVEVASLGGACEATFKTPEALNECYSDLDQLAELRRWKHDDVSVTRVTKE
jgi:hypothetical protein